MVIKSNFKNFIILSLFLTNCNVSSDNSHPCENFYKADGVISYKYPSGNTRTVFEVKNCTYNGILTEYFENGKLKRHGSYSEGKKVNIWTEFSKENESIVQRRYDSTSKLIHINHISNCDTIDLKVIDNSLLQISNNYTSKVLSEVKNLEEVTIEKADSLYKIITTNDIYITNSSTEVFFKASEYLSKKFLKECQKWDVSIINNTIKLEFFRKNKSGLMEKQRRVYDFTR